MNDIHDELVIGESAKTTKSKKGKMLACAVILLIVHKNNQLQCFMLYEYFRLFFSFQTKKLDLFFSTNLYLESSKKSHLHGYFNIDYISFIALSNVSQPYRTNLWLL